MQIKRSTIKYLLIISIIILLILSIINSSFAIEYYCLQDKNTQTNIFYIFAAIFNIYYLLFIVKII